MIEYMLLTKIYLYNQIWYGFQEYDVSILEFHVVFGNMVCLYGIFQYGFEYWLLFYGCYHIIHTYK